MSVRTCNGSVLPNTVAPEPPAEELTLTAAFEGDSILHFKVLSTPDAFQVASLLYSLDGSTFWTECRFTTTPTDDWENIVGMEGIIDPGVDVWFKANATFVPAGDFTSNIVGPLSY